MLKIVYSWSLPSNLPWSVSPRSWYQALLVHTQSTNIFRCILLQCRFIISSHNIHIKTKVHGCKHDNIDNVKYH